MDIQMPVMDGYEAAKIIKNDLSKQIAKIPIIAMTAYTAKEDIEKAFEAGMNDYIFKPFDANPATPQIDTLFYSYRVPNLTPDGQYKALDCLLYTSDAADE